MKTTKLHLLGCLLGSTALLGFGSCSNYRSPEANNAATGALIGAGVGAAVSDDTAEGAAVGAAAGGGAGYLYGASR